MACMGRMGENELPCKSISYRTQEKYI